MKGYLNNETIAGRHLIAIMVMYMMGSSVVLGVSTTAGNDSWMTLLIALAISIPIVLMYARIVRLSPKKGLFDILEDVFGKIFGKLVTVLFILYALYLGAMVVRDFADFAQMTTLTSTPKVPIMLLLTGVTAYLVATGIENFGRSVFFPLIIVLTSIFLTLLISFSEVDMNNFLPIFSHSVRDYAQGTFNTITFPFAETVLFLPLFDSVKKEDSPYKIYISGILLGSVVLMGILFRNIGLLGSHTLETTVFPSYRAARLLTFGKTLERVEAIVTYNFVFTGIAKIAVCLFAAAKGVTKLFSLGNYRQILLPVSLLTVSLAVIVFRDPAEIISFYNVSPYFFAIFQIPIPIVIWIGSEIKSRRRKKTSYI